jgi:hypothetical protein
MILKTSDMARMLMSVGGVLFIAGALIWLASKFNLPFGKLPGDFAWTGKNIKVFFPFASMIILSVLLTIILNVIARIGRK